MVIYSNLLKEVKYILNVLDFIDIWCCFNLEVKRFIWRRRKFDIYCCLDFFLISFSLSMVIINVDILFGYKIDYFLIFIYLVNNVNFRGLGFWKLNIFFLLDEEYVGLIKKIVIDVVNEYVNNNEIDVSLLWDIMKM